MKECYEKNRQQPLVSVLVAVYNVSEYLPKCLDSIVNQTLDNIEIICVDDRSSDNSAEIVRNYMEKDKRIVGIFKEQNEGTVRSRKDAVQYSRGKYIMFVDGDDELYLNACETAFLAIEECGTDMVGFGVNCVNAGGVKNDRLEGSRRFMQPCLETILAENLIFSCWKEKKFGFIIWNRIYKGNICRKAFSMVEDFYGCASEDLYLSFIIAYYSKSYKGIEDVLYCHNYGVGIVGDDFISLKKFDSHLKQKTVWDMLRKFVHALPDTENYEEILENIYQNNLLGFNIIKWRDNLKNEDVSEGFQRLVDTWGLENVISGLVKQNWHNPEKIAEKILDTDCVKPGKRDLSGPLTIAVYYQAAQEVRIRESVRILCNLLANMMNDNHARLYRVICVTDTVTESENGDEMQNLDPAVEREFVPLWDEKHRSYQVYRMRSRKWNELITEYNVHVVVSSAVLEPAFFWDMLSVKCHPSKPAFVMYLHDFYAVPYTYPGGKSAEMIFDYQLCDGVVTVSEENEAFIRHFATHTACIREPIPCLVQKAPVSSYEESVILWEADFLPEKRPLDVVQMMKLLVSEIPEVKLYMAGHAAGECYEAIREYITELNLEKNIILIDYKDCRKMYKKASVFIGTSECEGSAAVYDKAFVYGIPVIAYKIPWLKYDRDGRCVITVEQGRLDLLAKEISLLLKDKTQIKTIGLEARQTMSELEQTDISIKWKSFFSDIGRQETHMPENTDMQLLLKSVTMSNKVGIEIFYNKLHQAYCDKAEINRKLQKTYKEKSEINRKLQITYKEKAERGETLRRLSKEIKNEKDKNRKLKQEIKRLRNELDKRTLKGFLKRVIKRIKMLLLQ